LENFLNARHTPGIQKLLKNTKVAIAGLGGLGSHIASSLARMGIGHLKLVDFDIVDPTNIHRQYYFIDQIGMYKTDALLSTLKRINPFIRYETKTVKITEKNIPELFKEFDFLFEALDNAEAKSLLINTALAQIPNIIIIGASGVAGLDSIEKVKIKKLGKRLYVVGDFISETKPGNGLIATRITAIANIQAHIAIRKIIGEL
jgi:sulfur carrier protein ThiS adenylyltransferase